MKCPKKPAYSVADAVQQERPLLRFEKARCATWLHRCCTACKPGPTGSGAFLLTRLPVAGLSTPRGIRAIVYDVTAAPSPAGGAGGENVLVESVTY